MKKYLLLTLLLTGFGVSFADEEQLCDPDRNQPSGGFCRLIACDGGTTPGGLAYQVQLSDESRGEHRYPLMFGIQNPENMVGAYEFVRVIADVGYPRQKPFLDVPVITASIESDLVGVWLNIHNELDSTQDELTRVFLGHPGMLDQLSNTVFGMVMNLDLNLFQINLSQLGTGLGSIRLFGQAGADVSNVRLQFGELENSCGGPPVSYFLRVPYSHSPEATLLP